MCRSKVFKKALTRRFEADNSADPFNNIHIICNNYVDGTNTPQKIISGMSNEINQEQISVIILILVETLIVSSVRKQFFHQKVKPGEYHIHFSTIIFQR